MSNGKKGDTKKVNVKSNEHNNGTKSCTPFLAKQSAIAENGDKSYDKKKDSNKK